MPIPSERRPGALRRRILVPAALFALLAAFTSGCAQLPDDQLVQDLKATEDPDLLAERARLAFDRQPRDERTVEAALDAMQTAAIATERGRFEQRFERLRDATRYAIWLARHEENGTTEEREARVRRAYLLANTLADHAPDRVEGVYLRAVAAGLWAEVDDDYGLDAMAKIEEDAKRAIELDETYEEAGPHRILGALYLQAPAPPLGPGSVRRAQRELERACEIAPDHPGNRIYLAAAYRKRGDKAKAREAAAEADKALAAVEDPFESAAWKRVRDDLR
jgi:predicted Zn-dependent protease